MTARESISTLVHDGGTCTFKVIQADVLIKYLNIDYFIILAHYLLIGLLKRSERWLPGIATAKSKMMDTSEEIFDVE